jgi:hypothetical protein
MSTLRNTYFNCLTPDGAPVPWQPPEELEGVLIDSDYFGAALAAMDAQLQTTGLTFYLTRDLQSLPRTGGDVVAVVIGDELTRVPAYAARVRAIFKNQAAGPQLTSSLFTEPSWVNALWLAAYLRTWRHHAPGALRTRGRASIWMLPIGVLNQGEMPLKPVQERTTDLFFAGSVEHRAGASTLRNRLAPKVLAREQMVRAAQELERRHPELSVNVLTTGAFAESIARDAGEYSRRLMDARIALVPRGTTADTARFWQALRYGSVAVVDTVPREPYFYDGAPVVRISRWGDLEKTVVPLLRDPARLEDLSRRSREWWETRGAPEAVGAYMAERLDGQDSTGPPASAHA